MESEVCVEKRRNDEDTSWDIAPLATISIIEAKNVEKPNSKVAADGKAIFGPITPDADRENGEVLVDLKSPLTWVSSSPRADEVAVSDPSPRTPKEDVFDPFAPGPDELMLAPRCKKYLEESRNHVWRRLNFDSGIEPFEVGNSMKSISQEQLFIETVYESILEEIVSQQVEALEGVSLPFGIDCDGCRTPELLPLLNGVAETCPGAPVKPTRKLRNIDKELCRKLEF
ncbi:hypothetical protein NE237_005451 [Protea cynaroides]|uniref:Uncharacterized protein n=1 Tax=Protea cynaroides TaxID=273540 RepID=A0A9Q0KKM5_9MAGN|nr:hypothetical protein NE237_005451 [Protea cynaroides]